MAQLAQSVPGARGRAACKPGEGLGEPGLELDRELRDVLGGGEVTLFRLVVVGAEDKLRHREPEVPHRPVQPRTAVVDGHGGHRLASWT